MIGISTAWRAGIYDDGNQLLDEMLKSGLNSLEVDYRITNDEFKKIKKRLQKEFQVLSVHNFTPIPEGIPKNEASGDLFMLSSPDEDERKTAVKNTIKTIQHAVDLNAMIVVLHLGQVEMDGEIETIEKFKQKNLIDSKEYHDFLNKKLNEREQKSGKYFNAILKSLDELNERACKLGILLGAENRYRYTQIPFSTEFDTIFQEFSGGNIRYWHDVGHAEIFHRLNIQDHVNDFLLPYKEHLAGFHIHDIKGIADHNAPGQGDFDFSILKPFMEDYMIKILEIHPHESAENVQQGIEYLYEQGLF